MNLVRPKYYMLQDGVPIRLLSRTAWEKWIANTLYETRILAKNVVDNLVVETYFRGVVEDDVGMYESIVFSAPSGERRVIRKHPGKSSGQALTGHLNLIKEITDAKAYANGEQGCK